MESNVRVYNALVAMALVMFVCGYVSHDLIAAHLASDHPFVAWVLVVLQVVVVVASFTYTILWAVSRERK